MRKDHYQYYETQKVIQIIQTLHQSQTLRVLDVGAGQGKYLQILKDLSIDVLGVELNPSQVQSCVAQNLPCIHPDQLNPEAGKFDLILFSHLIEHVDHQELTQIMTHYIQYLNPNGWILIATPTLGERFYYDYTHIKPYYPQSIWHGMGTNSQPISAKSSFLLELHDLYFIRDCPKTRLWRSYYIRQNNSLKFWLCQKWNQLLTWGYIQSHGRLGPIASWIGLYKVISSKND